MMGLAAAEVGAGVGLAFVPPQTQPTGFSGAGKMVPWLMLQDLYVYSYVDAVLEVNRARRRLYVPQDTTSELLAAPFNGHVLKRPMVWGGIVGLTGAAIGLSYAIHPPAKEDLGAPPNVYGQTVDAGLGYPVGVASGMLLFEHVALAEEALFRGMLQSGLVRSMDDEWAGWAVSSLIFGAFHAVNIVALPTEQWRSYLLYSLPVITVVGSYIGLTYKVDRYSLTGPVALHFWYDLLLSMTAFALDPENNLFSIRVGGSF